MQKPDFKLAAVIVNIFKVLAVIILAFMIYQWIADPQRGLLAAMKMMNGPSPYGMPLKAADKLNMIIELIGSLLSNMLVPVLIWSVATMVEFLRHIARNSFAAQPQVTKAEIKAEAE